MALGVFCREIHDSHTTSAKLITENRVAEKIVFRTNNSRNIRILMRDYFSELIKALMEKISPGIIFCIYRFGQKVALLCRSCRHAGALGVE